MKTHLRTSCCSSSGALTPATHQAAVHGLAGQATRGPAALATPATPNQGPVLTPTDQLEGDPLSMLDGGRRSSSGQLLSPDVLDASASGQRLVSSGDSINSNYKPKENI